MNQTCKVCGEPAAGFHFGAFTCEGCKSFFGRSYNNLSSISDCKNNGECIINKKNRTACKACRLRKCLMVGMSKSGSRYGRRSNWFKIHCLLQEQQQQAAAAMAVHQNNPPQSHGAAGGMHVKPPQTAAAAALGMLGHAGAYSGLYPPRTKEELMMLSLEEYAKHPAASPSLSSTDSHNSDGSVEVNGRANASLMHLSNKHGTLDNPSGASSSSVVPPPPPPHPAHLRKDLPPFLPLSFPALSSIPVMPPPSFLPPSHLLFPSYHPAFYQHAHAGLLKPSAEQQAAAAAVHQLFNNAPRFHPTTITTSYSNHKTEDHKRDKSLLNNPSSDILNSNHLPNGSKAAEELTKRFYLDAVLKSQQQSPPPIVTKIPNLTKHDHSISALVTPNSESGRNHSNTSRESNEEEDDEQEHQTKSVNDTHSNGHASEQHNDDEEEDLVVSMTPPRSPIDIEDDLSGKCVKQNKCSLSSQDNPIDLSMKTASSVSSCVSNSNRCDSLSDHENDSSDRIGDENREKNGNLKIKEYLNNNNNNNESEEELSVLGKGIKRKYDEDEEISSKVTRKMGSALDLTNKL